MRTLVFDELRTQVYPDRLSAGNAAGKAVSARVRDLLEAQERVRVVFACAPSQDEFLAALCAEPAVNWQRMEIFHMDEYIGLSGQHPSSFRTYLKNHLLDRVKPLSVSLMRGEVPDTAAECSRYAALLQSGPIDLICLGIGENGHIAFNDPPVADLNDPLTVKTVELDRACRQQQVNDGCFPDIGSVPEKAMTITVPVFRGARHLSVVVPGPAKTRAVRDALTGPVSAACPASILRGHPSAVLYLDEDSAKLL